MSSIIDIDKYNTCAKICGVAVVELKNLINSGELNINNLRDKIHDLINKECCLVYKKEKVKGIAFPLSISLNNCTGNYIYEESMTNYNTIKDGDVIKYEFGVNIGMCSCIYGDTLIYSNSHSSDTSDSSDSNDTSDSNDSSDSSDSNDSNYTSDSRSSKYLNVLNNLQKNVIHRLKHGETNDEIRKYIESYCSMNNCFPLENCISYQHMQVNDESHIKHNESKYMICNYKKYYMEDDTLFQENLCFEFEQGEVYHINLTIVPNDNNSDIEHVFKEIHSPHIYRCNEYYYALKLKSSRDFFSEVKNKHFNNAFILSDYTKNVRGRMGFKECYENGVIEEYPIYYNKSEIPIYHKKFTVVVGKSKGMLLKYQN
jgi:methionine aminopeptidase